MRTATQRRRQGRCRVAAQPVPGPVAAAALGTLAGRRLPAGPAHLCIGVHEVVLDFIHRVRPVRHGAQVQPLKHHLVLGEGS